MSGARDIRPADERDLLEAIRAAAGDGRRLAISGGATKADIGRPSAGAVLLDMRAFSGVVDYDPAELILVVGAGTPLAEVETLLARDEQMLAFEPFDHGPIFGRPPGCATIGGVIAAAVAGSQRLSAGAARDHLLGFRAVSGRGELLNAGARVIKNVTGYDLPKLAAGSWGRLFATTELTIKLLPRPKVRETYAIAGLSPERAIAAMAKAMGSQADVAAAAHLPPEASRGTALTLLRLQGFGPSVRSRGELLARCLAPFGALERLGDAEGETAWDNLRTLAPLGRDTCLWRLHVAPSRAAALVRQLEAKGAGWMLDWAGGVILLGFDGEETLVRAAAAAGAGEAALLRGPASLRTRIPTFQPRASGVGALEARIRRAFDPQQVFETGRFGDAP